ncbi:MAG: 4Fe-4S binding protein [Candidatus Accumulibacter sp.]|nr:4Fe-4S binding protein [Accumulibacter sp.]
MMNLLLSALTGTLVWELVNPVSMLQRGLIFRVGAAWTVVAAVFLFDLFVMSREWCGHLCPVGAFYSVLGQMEPTTDSARRNRAACNDCMDHFEVCPEPQVIRPALKERGKGVDRSFCSRQLYQLRALHRCLFQGCLHVRTAFQQPARQWGADRNTACDKRN